jgi:G3E family GTPase
VVDGKHIWNHLTVRRESEVLRTSRGSALGEVVVIGQEEVASQIAYADRVIVNKVDLIEKDDDKEDEEKEEKEEEKGKDNSKDKKEDNATDEDSKSKGSTSLKNAANNNNESSLSSQDKKKRGLEDVCKAIRSLNPRADILKATNGKVALNQLLGIKAFDLKCQV